MIQLHVAEANPELKEGNVQHCVGYRVCFATRGHVLFKSGIVEIRMLSLVSLWM